MLASKSGFAVLILGLALASASWAADSPAQTPDRTQAQKKTQEQIYGSQLMTAEERTEYRNKMRAAKTQADKDRIRSEHHTAMQARAKERGVTLPDKPQAKGKGAGGAGLGAGKGAGGAGQGKGPGAGSSPGAQGAGGAAKSKP
jgi:hypothetical protein